MSVRCRIAGCRSRICSSESRGRDGVRTMTDNIRRILSPLLIISYVVGARIVEFPAGNPRPRFGLSYMLLLWSAYHFLLVYTVMSYVSHHPIEYHLSFWLNNFVMLLSVVFGVYYDKTFRRCLKRLDILDNTLEKMGTVMHYQRIHAKIISVALVWFVLVVVISYVKSFWFSESCTVMKALYLVFMLDYCAHVNLISDLIIMSVLGYIGLKFDHINEYLRRLDGAKIKPDWHPVLLPHRPKYQSGPSTEYITWIVIHLHLELRKISREINSMFGLQMALKMGCYFAFIALYFFDIFNATLNNESTTNDFDGRRTLFLFLIVFSLILYFSRLLLINYICERVSCKADESGDLMDRISYSTRDDEIRENILLFLLQMRQSPLRFSGLGLFQFGVKFLYGFVTSVATVIVLLLQGHA